MDESLCHEQISYLFFTPLFGKTFDNIHQLFLNSCYQFYVRTAAALIFTLFYLLTIICNPFLCQVNVKGSWSTIVCFPVSFFSFINIVISTYWLGHSICAGE